MSGPNHLKRTKPAYRAVPGCNIATVLIEEGGRGRSMLAGANATMAENETDTSLGRAYRHRSASSDKIREAHSGSGLMTNLCFFILRIKGGSSFDFQFFFHVWNLLAAL